MPGSPRYRSDGGVFGEGPALIGHRGLGCGVVWGHRENTLDSFATAAGLGIAWVEADVRRTSDDVLVVAHDAAYPDGTYLADLRAEEADRRGSLRLSALLEHLPADVGLNVDLKSSIDDSVRRAPCTTAGLLGPVVEVEAARRRLMVSSFDPGALCRLRRQAPRVPLGWLTWRSFPLEAAVAGCAHMDVDVLGLHVGSLGWDPATGTVDRTAVSRTLSFVHGSGRQLLVWCPEAQPARVLVEAGTDAVVVDEVPGILGALADGAPGRSGRPDPGPVRPGE
ncbi:glycerophosphodiester phosphodiesterase [Geodermatophilus ruber]|uniref:glycerophosphodiester phosphodiesterase n=1 Tax=Geodermatophilus ruber TaxID=504800 RepID=UPI0015A50779|nr:glycerophosphodiester phosphodiesterase [Geodermatophilus ruber]